jgi:hypothetical protein
VNREQEWDAGEVVKAERAIALFGVERVLLIPEGGVAPFADNPAASTTVTEKVRNDGSRKVTAYPSVKSFRRKPVSRRHWESARIPACAGMTRFL